jgi:hypothetical protein
MMKTLLVFVLGGSVPHVRKGLAVDGADGQPQGVDYWPLPTP